MTQDHATNDVPATDASAPRPPRIVVIGGGFAGLAVVEGLAGVHAEVLLLDRNAYATFQPLLYQVATGGLNPGDVTHALRAFTGRFGNARFRQADVVGLDTDEQRVHTNAGQAIDYDWLVVCTGATANYFDIDGAAAHARPIYTRAESIDVRDRVFSNLEAYAQGRPHAVEPVVVVVGGGPTGVEMAGMLAELASALPRTYPEIDPDRARVVLVEMTDHVLGGFEPALRDYAAQELRARGVELRLGTAVTEVSADGVTLDDGQSLPAAATIWASGVKVDDAVRKWGLPLTSGGRIEVEADLRVTSQPRVFAIGDVAATADDPLPQLAQPAMDGGRHVADQLRRVLRGKATQPFDYRSRGMMATIGRADAIVQLPRGPNLTGGVAWLAWGGLHIAKLMGSRNRLASLTNLTARYLTGHGQTNVIVGDPPSDRSPTS